MILINPNNPTGKILPEKLQDIIIEVAKENNLYVLSDEIYSQYAKTNWKSILSYNYEKSIVTQSFSKSRKLELTQYAPIAEVKITTTRSANNILRYNLMQMEMV